MLKCYCLLLLLASSVCTFAAENSYGLLAGSFLGSGGAGIAYNSGGIGVHPDFGGSVDVGIHKYLGVFGGLTYTRLMSASVPVCYNGGCSSISAKASLFDFSGGIEVTANNASRVVPFAKGGGGYGRASGSVMGFSVGSTGAPAAVFGGGVRVYLTKHFGINAEVLAYHYVGNNGGGTSAVSMFGIFGQTR